MDFNLFSILLLLFLANRKRLRFCSILLFRYQLKMEWLIDFLYKENLINICVRFRDLQGKTYFQLFKNNEMESNRFK